AALQPLLHAPDRPAPGGLSQESLLPQRGPRALRAGAPRTPDGHRAGPRSRPGRGVSEPDPARLPEAVAPQADAVGGRWAPEPPRADPAGPGRLRPAHYALARRNRRHAGRPARVRAGTPRPGDARYRGHSRRPARAKSAVPAPATQARRHGLGRSPPRRALHPGIRLGRAL